jgi:hypothetical protein
MVLGGKPGAGVGVERKGEWEGETVSKIVLVQRAVRPAAAAQNAIDVK